MAQRAHVLHQPGASVVHRCPAQVKVVALVVFMLAVVALPRTWYAVHGVALALLAVVIVVAGLRLRRLLPAIIVEVPFVLFALLMPLIAHGPRTEMLGVSVSATGLAAAIGLLMKATLGVLASLTLAATTTPAELLQGLRRLRVPDLLVQIMGFTLRYVSVVTSQSQRMLIAMRSRGLDPRSPRHWPALAASLGALFIRSYERGERVHVAMLSRGYTGAMPELEQRR